MDLLNSYVNTNNFEIIVAKKHNLACLLCQHYGGFGENQTNKVPVWSAYHSLTCDDNRMLTNVTTMPLLHALAHEWNTFNNYFQTTTKI